MEKPTWALLQIKRGMMQVKRINFIILQLIIMGFNNCKAQENNSTNIYQLWNKDSIGCYGFRLNNSKLIFSQKKEYYHMSMDSIVALFGKPNFYNNKNQISYIISLIGDWCENPKSYFTDRSNFSDEVIPLATIEFSFDSNSQLIDISETIY